MVLSKEMNEIVRCLTWYVDNDDTNEGDPSNEYWLGNKQRAQKALEALKPKGAL